MNPKGKFALATVTTENYLQWSMVMIHSFLKSNPWFKGDIVIISNDLSEKSLSDLTVFPGIIIAEPSEILTQRLAQLCAEMPTFSKLINRFLSIEVFRLDQYDKILFLDSDMLVIKNVEVLFRLPDPIYASLEWFSGKGRRMSDFEVVNSAGDHGEFIKQPINSGFLMLSKSLFTEALYEELVHFIHPGHWKNTTTRLTDQLIINKFFNDKITIIDARYNYRPKNAEGIYRKEKIRLDDAKIVHFMLKAKPWNLKEVFKTASQKLEMLKAFELWYEWYFDFLTWFHLQQKINYLTSNRT
jgi:lipopolysaccharide biosynthesis glycosyltransferase